MQGCRGAVDAVDQSALSGVWESCSMPAYSLNDGETFTCVMLAATVLFPCGQRIVHGYSAGELMWQ